MSTRISSLALLALPLAACGQQRAEQAVQQNEPLPTIPCAHGQGAFARTCTIEQAQARDGLVLTLRHADGAFRRLLVTHDGRGVIAADGAEPAVVRLLGSDGIDVALGGDRYRLPATIKGAKPAA